MFEREIYYYNDCPIYSDNFMPYVSPYDKKEDCCRASQAKRILAKGPELTKKGVVNIRYIKAKMTMHEPLSAAEIVRLMEAQINANGYAGRKGFNVLPGVVGHIKAYAISSGLY